jgi:hypothetical protein
MSEQVKIGNSSLRMACFLQVINLFQFVFFFSRICQVVHHALPFSAVHVSAFVIRDPLSCALCMPLLPSVLFLTSDLKRIIKNLLFFVILTKGNGILYHQSKIDFV